MDFKNKVVIITGAAAGIGAVTAKMFNDAGARVVLVDCNETKLSAMAARCSTSLMIHADIANDDDARRIIDQTIKNFGQIDVLVNNAVTTVDNGGLLADDLMKAYDRVMNVNFRAVVYLTNLAAPYLVKTKGNIVNISSIGGLMPPFQPSLINYFVSKAAMNHFTVCAATELGRYGVRVNVVSPGPVRTDIFENVSFTLDDLRAKTILDQVSEPEETAELIMFLASDKAKAITGSNYVSDNGMLLKRC